MNFLSFLQGPELGAIGIRHARMRIEHHEYGPRISMFVPERVHMAHHSLTNKSLRQYGP